MHELVSVSGSKFLNSPPERRDMDENFGVSNGEN